MFCSLFKGRFYAMVSGDGCGGAGGGGGGREREEEVQCVGKYCCFFPHCGKGHEEEIRFLFYLCTCFHTFLKVEITKRLKGALVVKWSTHL